MEPLKKNKYFTGPEGPVVLAILDGVGIGKYEDGHRSQGQYADTGLACSQQSCIQTDCTWNRGGHAF